jgi:SpoVK/Ycf46/Vps4 family AAA+-type ATPase
MIEYYQGILFLTTNRAQDFDEAFENQIHVTISYPKLDPEARVKIWKFLIRNNATVRHDESWSEAAFKILGELDINVSAIKLYVTCVFLGVER